MKIAVDVIWVLPCSRALCQDNRQLIELAINLTHLIHPASKSIALNLFYSAWPNSLSKSPLMCFGFHGAKSSVWTLDIYIFFIRQYYPSQTKKTMLLMHWSTSSSLRGPESTLVAPAIQDATFFWKSLYLRHVENN